MLLTELLVTMDTYDPFITATGNCILGLNIKLLFDRFHMKQRMWTKPLIGYGNKVNLKIKCLYVVIVFLIIIKLQTISILDAQTFFFSSISIELIWSLML